MATGRNGDAPSRAMRELCRRIVLPGAGAKRTDWRPLIAALRVANAENAAPGGDRIAPRYAVPFTDVVVRDPLVAGAELAKRLQIELDVEFASSDVEMTALSIRDPRLLHRHAYFGYGVFAPVHGRDVRVADLLFSWEAPDARGVVRPADALSPNVSDEQPAAWYAGQSGLAIGFDAETDHCPVRLDVPADMPERTRHALARAVLFVGRQSRHERPRVEMHPALAADENGSFHASGDLDQALRGWAPIDLEADGQPARLWVRICDRTGASRFSSRLAGGASTIAVKGVLLPQIAFFPRFGGPRRWLLHTKAGPALRESEIWETRATAVRESFGRCAAFHHANSGDPWESSDFEGPRGYRLPIGEGQSVEVHRFPGAPGALPFRLEPPDEAGRRQAVEKARELRAKLVRLYGKGEWVLLAFSDFGDLGFLDVSFGMLSSEPHEQTDVERGGIIGLDWLNRSAQVEVGGRMVGAARYWTERYEGSVSRDGNQIAVDVKRLKRRREERFHIRLGDRGMLGPFYVEFREGGAAP